jgi:VWFA-related protein
MMDCPRIIARNRGAIADMKATARIFLGLCWLPIAVLAQQSPPAATPMNTAQPPGLKQRPALEPDTGIKPGSKTRPITLDVVVTDVSGKRVAGLTRDDFTITENGRPQTIGSFREVDGASSASDPVQAVLLIDTVSNSFESVAAERSQIETFLARDGGRLPFPISIVLFSDSGAQVDQPSRDGNLLIAELKKTFTAIPTINAAMSAGGAIERFQRSLKVLNQLLSYEGARPGRKLLLWIGPGWPMLSGTRFTSSEKDKRADWDGIVNLSAKLRAARVTLYSVDTPSSEMSVGHAVYYENFLKPVTDRRQANPGDLALPVLAIQSGGRVVSGSNDLAAEISSCLEDAKSYYTVSFEAAHSAQADEYRALAIKVDKSGLTVRTNTGYYAQPGSF